MTGMTDGNAEVTPLGAGTYRVTLDGRSELVYVTGSAGDWWAFWNGRVFRAGDAAAAGAGTAPGTSRPRVRGLQQLTAPMPATVVAVPVAAGDQVKQGDAVVVLEAMKMELPLRAPADATVRAVHCRVGELVAADTVLVELE
jgi:acetyl/propionyl-CoA carboxylase alpha subunit